MSACIFDGGDGEGRASAGRDAYDDIFFCRLLLRDCIAAQLTGVFVGFHGRAQRFWAAGDYELDHARVDVKGGRTFDGVEGGDASAGAGAYVDEASALGERRGNQIDGLRDLPESALHGGRDLGIFSVNDASDFERGLAVEIGGGEVGFLGSEAAEVRSRCFTSRRFANQQLAFQTFTFQAIFPEQPVV